MRRVLYLCLALTACSPAVRPPHDARQAEATEIVWETYASRSSAPAVEWVSATPCRGDAGFTWGGECVAGVYLDDEDLALVEWLGSYAGSAFAHELLHAWQARLDPPVFDPNHLRPEWHSLLIDANDCLRAAGL